MNYLRGKTLYKASILTILLSLSLALDAQDGQSWIVSYKMGTTPKLQQLKAQDQYINARCIFKSLNLWQITTPESKSVDWIKYFDRDSNIRYFHKDIIAQSRYAPNDPDFPAQWNMNQIGMDRVWDITTGGTLPNGDDIVVAIFDDGFQLDHPEYATNIWHNRNEISDNGIDDDNNGYIDDVDGWNSTNDNDAHSLERHGTSVAGLIGAKGDNQNQIAGPNWNVKMMLTSGGRRSGVNLGDIVAAYDYIYTQRKIYNETGGAQGAYVVVSNYSGGASNKFPTDFPSWCEVFESLGSVGVLNVGAAPNADTDIDIEGDLPGTCPSDFLIVVTNTDRLDRKVGPAGYGSIGVDIGAPGDDVITTDIGSSVDEAFFGTSAAAPQVAGTISLMYSLICPESFERSLTNPSELALQMKGALMSSVFPSPDLQGRTVSGGRLNAFAAVTFIEESAIGNCCEIKITDLMIKDESCIASEDGQIILTAEGKDLTGTLLYSIESSAYQESNRLGSFTRIPGSEYMVHVEDDMASTCFQDSFITVIPGIDECPFSEFAIEHLRDDGNNTITVAYTLDEQKDVQIQVHNSLGQLLYNQLVTPDLSGIRTHEINTGNWASGVYHASILATGFRDVESFYVIH
ncbi:MAG: hypothetical protein ACJA01_001124 [Saprospiraceae bacterium]|jgi:hypothetical protein